MILKLLSMLFPKIWLIWHYRRGAVKLQIGSFYSFGQFEKLSTTEIAEDEAPEGRSVVSRTQMYGGTRADRGNEVFGNLCVLKVAGATRPVLDLLSPPTYPTSCGATLTRALRNGFLATTLQKLKKPTT